MTSMPLLTKYLGAQASSSRLPEAKPWYACTAMQYNIHRAGSCLLTSKVKGKWAPYTSGISCLECRRISGW